MFARRNSSVHRGSGRSFENGTSALGRPYAVGVGLADAGRKVAWRSRRCWQLLVMGQAEVEPTHVWQVLARHVVCLKEGIGSHRPSHWPVGMPDPQLAASCLKRWQRWRLSKALPRPTSKSGVMLCSAAIAVIKRSLPALILAGLGGLVAAFSRDIWWPKLHVVLQGFGWLSKRNDYRAHHAAFEFALSCATSSNTSPVAASFARLPVRASKRRTMTSQ